MIDLEKLCELLSEYFDEELAPDVCAEIDELICEDSCCEVLFNTFHRTIQLCREFEAEEIEVPEEVHIRLCQSLKIEIKKKRF